MATRTAMKVKTDWARLAKQINPAEAGKLNKLKGRFDSNLVKVASLPESLPKIDWATYKATASDPKIVEQLEKSYSSLKIEPPKAPAGRLSELEKAQKEDEARYERFCKYAQSYIESAEVVKDKFKKMIPYKNMSMEDRALTFPLWSWTRENPYSDAPWGRTAGLSKEEMIAFEQPDPLPYATKTAWRDWEKRKAKFYS